MSEETWYKMLAVSFALHIVVVAAFSIPFKSTKKRIDLSSSYSVNLVAGPGGGGGQSQAAAPEARKVPGKPAAVVKETKKEAKPLPPKNKPVPIKKEDLMSLSKKKVPEKEGTTEEERERLEERIRNIKRKTEYFDVAKAARTGAATSTSSGAAGAGGLSGSGGGGGIVDPVMQKYYMDVKEKIDAVWRIPASVKKNLLTVMVIKIRRDGIVVDIMPETMSGNRLYDESIMRAIRAAEPLPRIPASIRDDTVEMGLNFRPEST